MRSVGSRASELEDDADGAGNTATATDRTSRSSVPPLPAITGIAAWDSALLEDYHRRRRVEKERAAEEAAAAAAAERAERFDSFDEDISTAAEAVIAPASSAPTGERRCECGVNDGRTSRGANGSGGATKTSAAATLLVPAAVSATATTATTTAATATASASAMLSHNIAASFEKTNEASDVGTVSESTEDSTSTDYSMSVGSSISDDDGEYDHDSAYGNGRVDDRLHRLRNLGMEENGLEHVQDDDKCGPHSPDHKEQHMMNNILGDGGIGEQDSQNDKDVDHERQYLSEMEDQQRADGLEESELARGEIIPPQKAGAPKKPRLRRRRRKRKLMGYELALELATRCLRKDGFNAKAYCLRAELEVRLGRRDRTMVDYAAAASLEVGDLRPRINMVL